MTAAADLAQAYGLLLTDPQRAEQICRAVLAVDDDPSAHLLLAGALRMQGDAAGALAQTQDLAPAHPEWPGVHFEHGMALGRLGHHAQALDAFARVERLGGLPGLWREIGDLRSAMGDPVRAEQAYLRHLGSQSFEPAVHTAVGALRRNDLTGAEAALRRQLALHADDVLALRLLAEILSATDRYEDAEQLLRGLLGRVPSFTLARYGLAMVLFHGHKLLPALAELETLLAREPAHIDARKLMADVLTRLGRFDAAARCLDDALARRPDDARAWSTYGHVLRALGRRSECEAAYRRAVALDPGNGDAYWGLANLKTYAFTRADVVAMQSRARAARGGDKAPLLFALGKALEDERRYEESWRAYVDANAAQRARLPHDAAEGTAAVQRAMAVFTPEFLQARADLGAASDAPIFIVGMPRSGSTLVEQILASHGAVEGTMELIELLAMVRRLAAQGRYPEMLHDLDADALRRLGDEYLRRASVFRKTDAPRFIDKMPNNFAQIGLIRLILPNAHIVDVRRHPLATCVSIFKQHWATGQSFAYDLADIGTQYRDYVQWMTHIDAVAPGQVHRVVYEDLVAQPEIEIRRLLTACGLAFDDACLRFHDNKRAVWTPSSEQVRRPINRDGLDNWRPFEPWLQPLVAALGPALAPGPVPPAGGTRS